MKSNSACLTILVVCFWFMSPFTQSEERGRNFSESFSHVHSHSKLSTDKWSWIYGRTVEIMEGNEGIQQTLDGGYILCGWTRTFCENEIPQAWV